jgi:hypothetical protein
VHIGYRLHKFILRHGNDLLFRERPCHGDTRSIGHLKPFNTRGSWPIGFNSRKIMLFKSLTEYIFITGEGFT